MITVTVKSDIDYNIYIENGIVDNCGVYIRRISSAQRILVVTDSNVSTLYSERVIRSLESSGFEVNTFVFKAGEESKQLSTIEDIINSMCEFGLSRSDLVVALGGGVCGDMAGFASAIYLRGINFVQMPTTLLAQIDSSVGGKTGCDLSYGKNLVGAFHNPLVVLIDPDTLNTLPDRYFNDGLAEAIKYGCIKSEDLFERIERHNPKDFILELIEKCVQIKRDIVVGDFKEANERMLLNFGHTFGHAIEKYYNFKGVSHGEAVGIGMVLLTKASEMQGLSTTGTSDRIAECLRKYSLPTSTDISYDKLSELCLYDKKRRGNIINLTLIRDIGSGFIHKIETKALKSFVGGKLHE